MKRKLFGGTTSVALPIFVNDTSSTTGAGLSLAHNAAGLVAEYRRQSQSTWTTITLSAGTLGTWSSGGWVVDGGLTGSYEVGLPDAVLASGVRWVAIRFRGATNMLPVLIEIEIDAVNYQSVTNFGLTNLDAAISSRSTYAGADTGGTTTLLTRVPSALSLSAGAVTVGTNNDKTGYALSVSPAVAGDAMTLTAGERTSIGTAVWATTVRGLTTFGSLIADIWANATRTLSAFAFTPNVTVTTNNDKTGYALSVTPPTAVQVRSEMDANSTRLANLDALTSSRSTYAGADTSGTTTLLTRVTSVVASQASVDTIDDFIDTEVAAIKTVTDNLATALELDGSVYRLTLNALELAPIGGGGGGYTIEQIVTAMFARDVEAGETFLQTLRIIRAVMAGVSDATDSQDGTVVFKRKDGTTTALTGTYTAQGDRTVMTVGTV